MIVCDIFLVRIFGWFLAKTSIVKWPCFNVMVVDNCEILPAGNSDERNQSSQMHSSCQGGVHKLRWQVFFTFFDHLPTPTLILSTLNIEKNLYFWLFTHFFL